MYVHMDMCMCIEYMPSQKLVLFRLHRTPRTWTWEPMYSLGISTAKLTKSCCMIFSVLLVSFCRHQRSVRRGDQCEMC